MTRPEKLTVPRSEWRGRMPVNGKPVANGSTQAALVQAIESSLLAEKSESSRLEAKRSADKDQRKRGHMLLLSWAEYRLRQAQGLGYPPANTLAKFIKSTPDETKAGRRKERREDDGEGYTHMTLTESQAQGHAWFLKLDGMLARSVMPEIWREAIHLVYAQSMTQQRAAEKLAIDPRHLFCRIEDARQYVAQQYDAGRRTRVGDSGL